MRLDWKKLAASIAIPLVAGGASGFLSRSGMGIYKTLRQPPLAPPGWLFPVVWTALYVLMGVSSYLIAVSGSEDRKLALKIYGVQLVVNMLWTPVFFLLKWYLTAFVILVLLWYLVVMMILAFGGIRPLAAKLQIPYLLWITFAGYLNLGIYLLNR